MRATTKIRKTTKIKPADQAHTDRCTFNSGFHDAVSDVRVGKPRFLVRSGPHTVGQVSYRFSRWYYLGYETGIEACRAGTYIGTSSQPAWLVLTDTDSDDGRDAAYVESLLS